MNLCLVTLTPLDRFYYYCDLQHRDLHSFPTRRSSDLCWTSLGRAGLDSDRVVRMKASVREVVAGSTAGVVRSEEHTSELQSRGHLVCRLLLEKKKRLERK